MGQQSRDRYSIYCRYWYVQYSTFIYIVQLYTPFITAVTLRDMSAPDSSAVHPPFFKDFLLSFLSHFSTITVHIEN